MKVFGQQHRVRKGHREQTHRACSPARTLSTHVPLMSRMGITRLANVTGLDRLGLPVYMAVRPNARSLSVSQGKGFDAESAKVSALMEAIELWHSEHVALPVHMSSYADLRGRARVVDIERLPIRAGKRLDPEAPIAWVEGCELMSGDPIWVPLELVNQDHMSEVPGTSLFLRSSNGLSSGNAMLEAILHGLCEVIERDAKRLWNLDGDPRRTKATQIDPATIDDPACRTLLERVEAVDAFMAMWDLTSDTEVPTYACLVLDTTRWRMTSPTHGYGCHPSPTVAMVRAITEAAQCRLTEIAGSRDDIPLEQYASRPSDPQRTERIVRYLQRRPPLDFRRRASAATDSFEDDLAYVLGRLRVAGIDTVAVVDLSKPSLGVPVVHVVVPGLEADVHNAPVELGARAQRRLAELAALDQPPEPVR